MAKWTAADVPALDGKVAIVTGASRGLGLETAASLAGRASGQLTRVHYRS